MYVYLENLPPYFPLQRDTYGNIFTTMAVDEKRTCIQMILSIMIFETQAKTSVVKKLNDLEQLNYQFDFNFIFF